MSIICLILKPNGNVKGTLEVDATTCNEFIGVSRAEYDYLSSLVTSSPTLQDLFTIPFTEDLQQMFMLGISIPVIAYLTAWGYGVAINWFSKPDHN